MRKFVGEVSTNKVGSECKIEFEVPDDATPEDIEDAGREAAFRYVEWNFEEVSDE